MAIWTTQSKHKSHLICFILVVIVFLIFRTMRKGVWEAEWVNWFNRWIFIYFSKLLGGNMGLSIRVHIENNILWFDYNLIVWEYALFSPVSIVRYKSWHSNFVASTMTIWSIFRPTVVHITVAGPYYGPLDNIFYFGGFFSDSLVPTVSVLKCYVDTAVCYWYNKYCCNVL